MTLYTQALTYASNNSDFLCAFFKDEIKKKLVNNKNLTNNSYFKLVLSLKDGYFIPEVIEDNVTQTTQEASVFNYNHIVLHSDNLNNIETNVEYAWELNNEFLEARDAIEALDDNADTAIVETSSVII